jgi:hypothetical protein
LTSHAYSVAATQKIVEAGGELKSFAAAKRMLKKLAGIEISSPHVRRLTDEVGRELARRRDQAVKDYLHHRVEPSVPAPTGAVVAVDGGRIQTRVPTTGQGPGVHECGWKEDKIACLYAVEGGRFAVDPHPEPPRAFLDAKHVDELAKEVHAQRGTNPQWPAWASPVSESAEKAGEVAEESGSMLVESLLRDKPTKPDDAKSPRPAWPPKRSDRTCVATMRESEEFGKMVAAEAHKRNFYEADHRAFLGDGQHYNWTIHKKWFADFEPILDFVHLLSYLYAAATVTSANVIERWALYVQWMRACWQGRTVEVVRSLQTHAKERDLNPPAADAPATDPRVVVMQTITYLTNNLGHVDYPRYRQMGLPVTSAAVESLIKEVNYRVKGTEKFWNHPEGAESILQVRAAMLSDDDRLEDYLTARPGSPHRYTRRADAPETTTAA